MLYFVSAWYLPNGIAREEMTLGQNVSFAIFRILTPIVWLVIMIKISKADVKGRHYMRYSFFAYCLHAPVIAFVKLFYEKFAVLGMMQNEALKYVIIVFLTYTICVLVAMFMKRYATPLWTLLNGGRK